MVKLNTLIFISNSMKEKICLVTGGFDPIHRGHVEYFKAAKNLGYFLVVGLNSDPWLERKKGYQFMPWDEREAVVSAMSSVDKVISFNDDDGTACNAIKECLDISNEVIFVNGGDRQAGNTPEQDKYDSDLRVHFEFGIGGNDKLNSSSWVAQEFAEKYLKTLLPKGVNDTVTIVAPWGHHTSFIDDEGFKVKQLNVNPDSKLSLQKHQFRSEHWVVTRGEAVVEIDDQTMTLGEGDYVFIPLTSVHRLSNETDKELIVVEVQCGKRLEESDIVRLEDSYGRIQE